MRISVDCLGKSSAALLSSAWVAQDRAGGIQLRVSALAGFALSVQRRPRAFFRAALCPRIVYVPWSCFTRMLPLESCLAYACYSVLVHYVGLGANYFVRHIALDFLSSRLPCSSRAGSCWLCAFKPEGKSKVGVKASCPDVLQAFPPLFVTQESALPVAHHPLRSR